MSARDVENICLFPLTTPNAYNVYSTTLAADNLCSSSSPEAESMMQAFQLCRHGIVQVHPDMLSTTTPSQCCEEIYDYWAASCDSCDGLPIYNTSVDLISS